MTITLISHPDCLRHDMGAGHLESPARLTAIFAHLETMGLTQHLSRVEAPQATPAELERVHEQNYVAEIFKSAPEQGLIALDPDTWMNPFSLSAALHAAGAVVHGVDLVMSGDTRRVFCAVRPPGHHAEHNRAMGFCLFNNIAVGAAHAMTEHGVQRLAILDFDVHHGNGTEDIFGHDKRVLFCSTFQHPHYPYKGSGPTETHIVNTPLPAGTDGAHFRRAVESHWLPAVEEFKPQLFLVSAGFDAHRQDPLAHFLLDEEDYFWVTRRIVEMADRFAHGRIVSTLEGGYETQALARSVTAHLEAMLNQTK